MTYIHGLGSNAMDYVISYIHVYNQIVKFDLLNDHVPESDHRPLSLTLNFVMHKIPIEVNSNERHFLKNIKLIFS
jgi:hypothetical protein